MEVNWLTVLNTVLNVEVWIKGTWRGREERGWSISLCFCFLLCFSSIICQVRIIVIYQLVCFLPVEILFLEYQRRGSSFFHPSYPLSFQPFISFPPPSYSPCHIPSRPFCCLPGFIRQQWGWKLHFSWNVSCCKAPAGVIFFFLQRWKHRAAFAALRVCKSEQWCTTVWGQQDDVFRLLRYNVSSRCARVCGFDCAWVTACVCV